MKYLFDRTGYAILFLFFTVTNLVVADEIMIREFSGVAALKAYTIDSSGWQYTARQIVGPLVPVNLYKNPDLNSKPIESLRHLHTLDVRGISLDFYGVSVFRVLEDWYEVKMSETGEYLWIKSSDIFRFVDYLDLLDNWQYLAGNQNGYLLHHEPNDLSVKIRASGFGEFSSNAGSLYVEVLEHKRVKGILWFKVAEITSELCHSGYPWDHGATGWIRAHLPNGDPVFNRFEIC